MADKKGKTKAAPKASKPGNQTSIPAKKAPKKGKK